LTTSQSASLNICAQIEARLNQLLPHEQAPLIEAMRYALLGPGKRLRPQLVCATAQMFDLEPSFALDPACAVEMVHAYSLIHDDLPCMDNDSLRRGRPTVHRIYGEAMALLAGDALLTLAFEVLAQANLDTTTKVQLIQCLSARAGKLGMVRGQANELSGSEEHLTLLAQKTGDLFSCCLEFGAILAFRDPQPLRNLGLTLGLIYQIRDDLEDGDSPIPRQQAIYLLDNHTLRFKEIAATLPKQAGPIIGLLPNFLI
jgi:geranylgeranyl pyrophosphate synthase